MPPGPVAVRQRLRQVGWCGAESKQVDPTLDTYAAPSTQAVQPISGNFLRLLLHPSPQGHEYQPKGVAQDVAELQTCPCTKGAYNNSNGTDFKGIWTHFRVPAQCHDSYLLTFTFKEAHGDVERDAVGLHLMQKMQV